MAHTTECPTPHCLTCSAYEAGLKAGAEARSRRSRTAKDGELIAELRKFHHYDAAKRLEELTR